MLVRRDDFPVQLREQHRFEFGPLNVIETLPMREQRTANRSKGTIAMCPKREFLRLGLLWLLAGPILLGVSELASQADRAFSQGNLL